MPNSDHPEQSRSRFRPPPNYGSRRVQAQLLMLVSCLMLVLVLILEAAKPDNWKWLWAGAKQQSQAEADPAGGHPPAANSLLITGETESDPLDEPMRQFGLPSDESDPGSSDANLAVQLEQLIWQRVYELLEPPQREQLNGWLLAARRGSPPAGELVERQPLLDRLDQLWNAQLDGLGELEGQDERYPPSSLAEARQVLQKKWQQELLPALAAASVGQADAPQRELLWQMQFLLDRLALQQIRDDTTFRPSEAAAWFRLLELLATSSRERLSEASLGPVSYLQLSEQPNVYRAKLVTIQGTVRLAYSVPAPRNVLGIDRYYLLWVQPAGAPQELLPVYALQLPERFPTVTRSEVDDGTAQLEEDVVLTGYFFKRWLYASRSGPTTAPLLLVKIPEWQTPEAVGNRGASLPGPLRIIITLGSVAALALFVCYLAYRWRTRPAPTKRALPETISWPPPDEITR